MAEWLQGLEDAPSVAVAYATEDDKRGGGGLLVVAGRGNGGRAGARPSSPKHPARRSGTMGSVGAGSGAGPGMPALVTSCASPDGGGWCQAVARRWCHSGRCCGGAGQLFAILNSMAAVLPVVAVGVGVLLGGHVWGRVDLYFGAKQTDLGSWLMSRS